MRTLKESILSDMETTLSAGDNFTDSIEDEFKVIKSIKNLACWEKNTIIGGSCTIYEYKWDCTNTMKSLCNEKRNMMQISIQYLTKRSIIGDPGWIITIMLKPDPPVVYKDGYAEQIFFKEFKITEFKNTNDLIKNFLLKDIFADYKTFSKFYTENKHK